MKPQFPSLTSEWHDTTYAAISPTNPSLSASVSGKTIVITGGGAGIGRETAKAYAEAGAAHVAILGRKSKTLSETQDIIQGEGHKTKVTTHIADVADEEAVQKAAKEIGPWDILILNAGYLPKPERIEKADLGEWWKAYETNVKGIIITTQSFLPTHNRSASIIGINAGIVQITPGQGPSAGSSAYTSSKIAQLKFLEFLAAEHPDLFIVSVHPGIVMTELAQGMEAESEGHVHFDDVKLPAHFNVWLASPEARFLRGKFVWANWDVEQLKARAKEIEETQMLTSNVLGWPYEPKE